MNNPARAITCARSDFGFARYFVARLQSRREAIGETTQVWAIVQAEAGTQDTFGTPPER